MSFFIKKQNKKKQGNQKNGFGKRPASSQKSVPRKKFRGSNEEIESDSDIDQNDDIIEGRVKEYSSSDEEVETVQEKKLRLAKEYLSQIEDEEREKKASDEIHKDISLRLRQDLLEQTGKVQRQVAESIEPPLPDDFILFRGHQLSVTCVVISPDSDYVFSASKDCSIIKWSIKERRRVHTIAGGRKGTESKHTGHTDHVLAMALSSDGKYLATGDKNKLIHIWDPKTCELLHTFKGHRDAVSGLTFRKDTHQLYSCSHDRSVKIWDVDERAYVETLFGHQDKITAIDSLTRERAVTSGGRDSSVRIWKIIEESQLVFNAHDMCSVDCVALINESSLISGADNNSLSLWTVMKKKPLVTVRNAHGGQPVGDSEAVADKDGKDAAMPTRKVEQDTWITSVAALHNTDLVASGSRDGNVKLWKCTADYRKLIPLCAIPVTGFVNSLQFSKDGSYLVAGVGQEHRLGRWWSNKKAKNGICIIPLKSKEKK